MLGTVFRRDTKPLLATDENVSKLFFDAFSRRVSSVEAETRALSAHVERLKASTERSQISDLVLLERLQKAETALSESLAWIKRVAELVHSHSAEPAIAGQAARVQAMEAFEVPAPSVSRTVVSPSGPVGTLSSIVTPTEVQVLTLLVEQGPKSAPEIGRVIGRSREHSARLMKKLYGEGYVRRDQTRTPFRYSVVERVRAGFKRTEEKEAGERQSGAGEVVAVPPS